MMNSSLNTCRNAVMLKNLYMVKSQTESGDLKRPVQLSYSLGGLIDN